VVDLSYDCASSKNYLNFFVSERPEEEGDEGWMPFVTCFLHGPPLSRRLDLKPTTTSCIYFIFLTNCIRLDERRFLFISLLL
jgi:hypothetical protein